MNAILLLIGGNGIALLYFFHLYGQITRIRKGGKPLLFWSFPVRFLLLALFLTGLLLWDASSALYLAAGLLTGRMAALLLVRRQG